MANENENKPIFASAQVLYDKALEKMRNDRVIVQPAYRRDNFLLAASMFEEAGDYLDAADLAEQCRKKAEETKEAARETTYKRCVARMRDKTTFDENDKVVKVADLLKELGDYKDAGRYYEQCEKWLRKRRARGKVIRITVLVLLLALIAGGIMCWSNGLLQYGAGVAMYRYGKYGQAAQILRSMPGYRSADRIVQQIETKQLLAAEEGSKVVYGDFSWQVLSVEDDILTMIAVDVDEDHIFYRVPFNDSPGEVTWKDSSLRAWLNGEVYDTYFTEEEKSCLVEQEDESSVNPDYGSAYEAGTREYLTLLSVEEAKPFMPVLETLGSDFWYRTPGYDLHAVSVMSQGSHTIKTFGYEADDENVAVRPVIKVDRGSLTADSQG